MAHFHQARCADRPAKPRNASREIVHAQSVTATGGRTSAVLMLDLDRFKEINRHAPATRVRKPPAGGTRCASARLHP